MFSFFLVVVLGLLGGLVRVPYVALGPGPTFDTLGDFRGSPVINVDGAQTHRTTGQLRMTTVSLTDDVTLFGALGLWISGRYALDAREQYFKPGETEEEVEKENVKQFRDSQSQAETAALRQLGKPIKVLAKEIVANSPADHKLAPGDELLKVHGKDITTQEDVTEALKGTRPGQTISVTFQHRGQQRTVPLKLAKRPPDLRGDFGFIGLEPAERADVPFHISIKLEDVGGPSAGLMFALAIVDRLTEQNLAAGKHIAGTGEIDDRGDVGEIGGITFKLVAAREAGANTFLVPEGNCAEARDNAPDGLRLIRVGTLKEAMNALSALRAGRPTPSC
ncbi:MAG: PDZ domain-containing protein [Pseudonocardiaceae bacterium]|nr:PDZ domain-containing protein [Pseudonocardiaceae bacterium]